MFKIDFRAKFEAALPYEAFLEQYASSDQKSRWERVLGNVVLTQSQLDLLSSMTREVNLLIMAGAWCGDCIEQCPIFAKFAAANPLIRVRFVDRDADSELTSALQICGAARVPQVVFLSEEMLPVGWYGDRTISRYRAMAAHVGASCSTGIGVTGSLLSQVTQDWLNELERIHWLLRTSPRLRQKHGD